MERAKFDSLFKKLKIFGVIIEACYTGADKGFG
jgi:hypothetical protein